MPDLLPSAYFKSFEHDVVPTPASKLLLDEALSAAGLQDELVVPADHSVVSVLRRTAVQVSEGPVLFALDRDTAKALVPERLSAVVWYVYLPAHLAHLAVLLTDVVLDGNAELSDDPWRKELYVKFQSRFQGMRWPELAVKADEIPIEAAVEQGFAVLLVDNGKAVRCSGACAGEVVLIGLSASALSSAYNPEFTDSIARLQARTRMVERTGIDPEGPTANGALMLKVVCLADMPVPYDYSDWIRTHFRELFPTISTDDSLVGKVGEVATVFDDKSRLAETVVRVRVNSAVFEQCSSGAATVSVVTFPDAASRDRLVWFLVIDAGTAMYLVCPDDVAADPEIAGWEQSSDWPVLIENRRNGRWLRVEPSLQPAADWVPPNVACGTSPQSSARLAVVWAETIRNERLGNVVVFTSRLVAYKPPNRDELGDHAG